MKAHGIALQLLVMALAGAIAFAASGQATDSTEDQYTLKKTVLMDTDRCVIVRLELTAAPTADANNTRLEWEFRPDGEGSIAESGHSSANGVYPPQDSPSRAEILFVAQVTPGNSKHPPMILFSTKQRSLYKEAGAASSQAHLLDKDMNVADVFHIDIESGDFPLQEDLVVGSLAGQPIHLFFGSDKAYGGKTAEQTTSTAAAESDGVQGEAKRGVAG